jgi:hypothetical protein
MTTTRRAPTRASAAAELLAGLERCLVTANPVMANFGARTGGPDGAAYTLSAPNLAAKLGTTMVTITALQQKTNKEKGPGRRGRSRLAL